MKRTDFFSRKWVAGLIVVGLMAMAASVRAADVPQVVKVLRIQGEAKYSTDNKLWQPLTKGAILKPGSVIMTAEKSTVDIVLCDKDAGIPSSYRGGSGGSSSAPSVTPVSAPGNPPYIPEEERANIIRIFQSSVLSVDKLTMERNGVDEVAETQLDLRAGQILGTVKKLSTASKYEVKIPNGVAGIRGTIYLISASGVVDVLKGSVVVAVVAADGSVTTRVVSAGHSFDPATGMVSTIPPELLARLTAIYHELHGHHPSGPTEYPWDHTIIFVSPVDGSSGRPRGGG
jgi:hypothetical protein